jgi:hypothetical protein
MVGLNKNKIMKNIKKIVLILFLSSFSVSFSLLFLIADKDLSNSFITGIASAVGTVIGAIGFLLLRKEKK